MRGIYLLLLLLSTVSAERDRTSCFNYIDCLEQAQRQFKSCSGGTAVALSLERRSRMMGVLLDGKQHILNTCSASLKKESLDFDTLQTLVNEDSRECFQKIPFAPLHPVPESCEYPLKPRPSHADPHVGCLSEFQKDRHHCERLLECCPEHSACAERMNALSIAYQLARKKSREISDKMMECIMDLEDKETKDKLLDEQTNSKSQEIATDEKTLVRGKKEAFPTLAPQGETTKYWIPSKTARLPTTVVGDEVQDTTEESIEVSSESTEDPNGKRVKISEKIIATDGGMPFKRPDREMMRRIQRRLRLTPSALLERNKEEFMHKFDRMRKEKEEEQKEEEYEDIEEEEENVNEQRKVAIVKFLLEEADAAMTEKVITMLATGNIKGLMVMERQEKAKRIARRKAILRALPAGPDSEEETKEGPGRRVSIESVIKQTLEKVNIDHREQKKALMKSIKNALAEQKQSMEKMAEVVKVTRSIAEAEEILEETTPSTTVVPTTTTTESTTTKKEEEKDLDQKEAKLSEELRLRLGIEDKFKEALGEETTVAPLPKVVEPQEDAIAEEKKKLDIRPVLVEETTTVNRAEETTKKSGGEANGERLLKKKRGKGARHARKSKIAIETNEPTEGFCLSYGQCESLVFDYEKRCDLKYNPITVTFGIEDTQLREMLLNNSKSASTVVTQVCLRPVDKSVHNSVLQLQHIERGVRKACFSLGRDKPLLTNEEREECRALSHFSVIEMEDWLEVTHGHTQANLAECQARTAGIAASCQELSRCCSAVEACEEYIVSSPVRKMRAEAIQLLLAQQDDCENRMEKTLRQLRKHLRVRPARRRRVV